MPGKMIVASVLALLILGAVFILREVQRFARGSNRATHAIGWQPEANPAVRGAVPLRLPSESEVQDTNLLAAIRRGRALLRATKDSLPAHVRSALQCVSCHPGDGTQANATPWIGVYARFPQYRSRSATMNVLEDRINDCFERSMNGRALPATSRNMRDIVAYMAFLSRGVPVGGDVEGQGLPKMKPLAGDTTRGATLFATRCATCHGVNGGGTPAGPPVWGSRSYNIGAGMARLRTAASFIRYNMPLDHPGTLTDQDAFDVATYVDTRPRPDFPGKEKDWPRGDAPPDINYPTLAAQRRAALRTGLEETKRR